MIKIIIELWPFGNEKRKEKLCEGKIANDGTGTMSVGNYNVTLFNKVNLPMKKGRVEGFARQRKHVWYLLYLAFKNIHEKGKKNGKDK